MIRLIGLILIIDATWSLQPQKNNHWFTADLSRWVRLCLGIILII